MHKSDISRNQFMLRGPLKKQGYDWWWHSFTAINKKTKEEKPFFIEFYICNPKLKQPKPVLGQLPYNQENHIKPSYVMVKVGCWKDGKVQLNNFYAIDDCFIKKGVPFEIKTRDSYCSETRTFGKVKVTEEECKKHPEMMSDFGEISWDLTIKKEIPFNVGYGASKFFRVINAFEMFWHVEGMKTKYEGTITFNSEQYIVDPNTCYGYADKNWGKNYTSPWIWLSSNNLESAITHKKLNNSVFDIGGGRPKVFFVPLKNKLLCSFYYEGKYYEFNFSKIFSFTKTKFNCEETNDYIIWKVTQETIKAKMISEFKCLKKDMLLINYESPDGMKRHNRLFNGGNGEGIIKLYKKHKRKTILIDEVNAKNVGCEYGEYDK